MEYYRVFFSLVSTNSGRPLRATPSRINFLADQQIGTDNQEYRDEFGDNSLGFVLFDQKFVGRWEYLDVGAQAPASTLYKQLRTRTEFLLGYRFTADDGTHYRWMRFTRPDTHFTTAFDLTSYDWNPLPGEPIGAGLPPVIPLFPEITEEGLRLNWPAAIASWLLEYTDELGPQAHWQPIPEASGTEILLPPPEVTRFYRIRRP